ncbi:MAG: LamB/YcsF family protein [Limimaricola soesokkakensis]|uniref:LamB/YcsF family protein n=1 Tax=Limimaricola soesokkakensis TaxID=1343159 RepID=UPI004058163A
MKINLNADLGESYGPYVIGNDEELLGVVGAANIACGFHGGDPMVIGRAIARAKETGASIGAHPGHADLQGFGRCAMTLSADELRMSVIYQVSAVAGMASALGHPITHVKPHGAMNNQACADRAMADIIAQAVAETDPDLILLAPALSELAVAGEAAGLKVALEIFADRTYEADASLTPRSRPGSVLHGQAEALDHVKRMIEAGGIATREGSVLPTPFHSICVHGDGTEALDTARALRAALADWGHALVTLPEAVAG